MDTGGGSGRSDRHAPDRLQPSVHSPAYQCMVDVSKPDGMPNPPEPLPDSARPPLSP